MDNPGVSIDEAHAHLLYGLVCAHKPTSVLEFGFGSGRSAHAILDALAFNQTAADYCIVDSWKDWSGIQPPEARAFLESNSGRVIFFNGDEQKFVQTCLKQYEFIFSDADHSHAQEWFQRTYNDLLAPGGILCYHDVCNFPNLWEIVEECKRQGLRYVVFDRCSRDGEACHRGLLVIFKSSDG